MLLGADASGRSTILRTITLLLRFLKGDLHRDIGAYSPFESSGTALSLARPTRIRLSAFGHPFFKHHDLDWPLLHPRESEGFRGFHNKHLVKEEVVVEKDDTGNTSARSLARLQRTRRDVGLYARYLSGVFGGVPWIGQRKRILIACEGQPERGYAAPLRLPSDSLAMEKVAVDIPFLLSPVYGNRVYGSCSGLRITKDFCWRISSRWMPRC